MGVAIILDDINHQKISMNIRKAIIISHLKIDKFLREKTNFPYRILI